MPVVPLLVGDLEDRRARPVAGAVDQHVDAPQRSIVRVDEALQVVVRLVRAGDAEAAELAGERLALAGRRQDRNPEAVGGQASRRGGAHPVPPAVTIATFPVFIQVTVCLGKQRRQ